MPTSLVILLVGIAAGAAAAAISISSRRFDPIDPTVEKHWLVRTVSHRPRLAAFIRRRLDRTRAGGLMLTFGFAAVLLLASVIGLLFDMVDADWGVARWDSAVARYGAEHVDSVAVELAAALTHLGGTGGIIVVTVLVGGWGWWRHRNLHVALFVATVAIGQAALNTGLKLLVGRDRPNLAQLAPWSGSSFPSGHSAAATAVFAAAALVLTLHRSGRARAIAAGVAASCAAGVATTRALLGVHWLTDVLAGFVVGLVWFFVSAVAFGGRIMRFGEPRDEVLEPGEEAGVCSVGSAGDGR